MSIPDADVTRLDVEGSVHHHLPEPKAQEWRAGIRKVSRDMGWKIRTGYRQDIGLVWAYRLDFAPQDPEAHLQTERLLVDELARRMQKGEP